MANSADLYNGKQLYIAHLATRLEAMERSSVKLNAFSYRLWSRRLREAMAGCPEPLLANGLAISHPSVAQALEQRHFNTHGVLPGPAGKAARHAANQLMRRLRLSHKR